MRRPFALLASLLAAGAWTAPAAAQEYFPPPINGHTEVYLLDTGRLDNPTSSPVTIFEHTIDVPGAPWLRVLFRSAKLSGASHVTLTSLADGSSQTLDAVAMEQWGRGSAFFNGPAVALALVAGPHSVGNRLVIEEILVGDAAGGEPAPEAICGSSDDRIPTPTRGGPAGRLLTATLGGGCTGFITDLPAATVDKCHLSAGHCFTTGVKSSQASAVMQFDVPDSTSSCGLQHPPADKQFPVKSFSAQNGGVGNDWAVYEVQRNSATGLSTYQEQQAAVPLAASVPATGTVQVTGYGVDIDGAGATGSACSLFSCTTAGQRNQIQQTLQGPIHSIPGTRLNHEVDTCGGSSGSPILLVSSGEAIGVHSHAGCTATPGTFNAGTQITHSGLQDALEACASFDIDHVKVYDATDVSVSIAGVILRDQFGDATVDLEDLVFFATPVDKNGEGLIDPLAHQTWYEFTALEPVRHVRVSNQLTQGEEEWTLGNPRYLVAPAAKGVCDAPVQSVGQLCGTDADCDDPPLQGNGICLFAPPEDNHFKCYETTGSALNVAVSLVDQFGTENTQVLEPVLLCNPAEKTAGGQTFPILHPDDHLACYRLPTNPQNIAPNAVDQFDPIEPGYGLQLVDVEMLCVPSTKVRPVPAVASRVRGLLAGALLLSALAFGARRLRRQSSGG